MSRDFGDLYMYLQCKLSCLAQVHPHLKAAGQEFPSVGFFNEMVAKQMLPIYMSFIISPVKFLMVIV